MKNIIYGLRDPRNDVYQYIGKSTVGSERALQHLTKSHSPRVNEWVAALSANWQYPIVDIIEEVDDLEVLSDREKYWIDYYYNINPDLLNVQVVPAPLQNLRTEEDDEKFNYLMNVVTDIPIILKNERLYRNLTQAEMAEKMGVNRNTIVECENGGNPRFNTIRKYVLTLKGVDIITKSHGDRVRKINIGT